MFAIAAARRGGGKAIPQQGFLRSLHHGRMVLQAQITRAGKVIQRATIENYLCPNRAFRIKRHIIASQLLMGLRPVSAILEPLS